MASFQPGCTVRTEWACTDGVGMASPSLPCYFCCTCHCENNDIFISLYGCGPNLKQASSGLCWMGVSCMLFTFGHLKSTKSNIKVMFLLKPLSNKKIQLMNNGRKESAGDMI